MVALLDLHEFVSGQFEFGERAGDLAVRAGELEAGLDRGGGGVGRVGVGGRVLRGAAGEDERGGEGAGDADAQSAGRGER
ncbi:hypothetical protein GCM10025870_10970 [Agromyces marinus]|uniref:Uncharacterized protein n=1 Tax=Agromyces marinus TaxID=1389020 RepID=A0ABM8GZU8_9MICO|nr:hypothetical protein [Agromyces marinus]BDZ54024.1 hypothetical protein GCM10025870_10970 [Agromyces marinus]